MDYSVHRPSASLFAKLLVFLPSPLILGMMLAKQNSVTEPFVIPLNKHTHARTYTHTNTHTQHIHTRTHTHTQHIHTRTHTHAHTRTHTNVGRVLLMRNGPHQKSWLQQEEVRQRSQQVPA
jgi:ABC-type nickel/cobalt efflux system permease component RcnA